MENETNCVQFVVVFNEFKLSKYNRLHLSKHNSHVYITFLSLKENYINKILSVFQSIKKIMKYKSILEKKISYYID